MEDFSPTGGELSGVPGPAALRSRCVPGTPLSGKLTWAVTQPWAEPGDEKERAAKQKALELIELLKKRQGQKSGSSDQEE